MISQEDKIAEVCNASKYAESKTCDNYHHKEHDNEYCDASRVPHEKYNLNKVAEGGLGPFSKDKMETHSNERDLSTRRTEGSKYIRPSGTGRDTWSEKREQINDEIQECEQERKCNNRHEWSQDFRESEHQDKTEKKDRSKHRDQDENKKIKRKERHEIEWERKNRRYEYGEDGLFWSKFRTSNHSRGELAYSKRTSTIVIRYLTEDVREDDIRLEILANGFVPEDVRLIRKRDTGESRYFAFVSFSTPDVAWQLLRKMKGVLTMKNGNKAMMEFSVGKDSQMNRNLPRYCQDWNCFKCGTINFKRRDTCFRCQSLRDTCEDSDDDSEVSLQPTSTVLLYGLDVLSTENSVLQAIKTISSVPIKNIHLSADPMTNLSRGICYLEMNNVTDAILMYKNLIKDPNFVVDGQKVEISYRKIMPPQSQTDVYLQQRDCTVELKDYTADDILQLADYSASLYAKSTADYSKYQQYYKQYYQTQILQGKTLSQTDSVNAAAAVAQLAIQQLQATKQTMNPPNETMDTSGVNDTINRPNLSRYHYDEVSGYYYDPLMQIYYDVCSNNYYYYNSQTQQYMQWNSDVQANLPASLVTGETVINKDKEKNNELKVKEDKANLPASFVTEETVINKEKNTELKDKANKVKLAKKIAKDMQRWAKILNQKKENSCQQTTKASCTATTTKASSIATTTKASSTATTIKASSTATATKAYSTTNTTKSAGSIDVGYTILEEQKKVHPVASQFTKAHTSQKPGFSKIDERSFNSLVADYGSSSNSEDEIEDILQEEKKHTDWEKLACLLCRRQFSTKQFLERHQQLSDLHKVNLETWYKVRGLNPNDPQQRNKQFRDRAKERRQKYNSELQCSNVLKKKCLMVKERISSMSCEEPTKSGIGSDNFGSRMLQKMGWQEGMGLGKMNQGSTTVVKIEGIQNTTGLGTKGTYKPVSGDTYKACMKKLMFARYQEVSHKESRQQHT